MKVLVKQPLAKPLGLIIKFSLLLKDCPTKSNNLINYTCRVVIITNWQIVLLRVYRTPTQGIKPWTSWTPGPASNTTWKFKEFIYNWTIKMFSQHHIGMHRILLRINGSKTLNKMWWIKQNLIKQRRVIEFWETKTSKGVFLSIKH